MTELFHADQDAPQSALTFQKQPLNEDIAAALSDAWPGIMIAGAILGGVFWVIAMVMRGIFTCRQQELTWMYRMLVHDLSLTYRGGSFLSISGRV